nr:hypothetical protein [Gammaproteobacteria bacterium]NIT54667.1 hypothetical protein [candidate division Zixibacteria bacterium]NIW50605.1 hypothetical protein [Gammaproteobacteria bacterium]NIX59963.1 hypothetical protein [candidate division Zixibacteria bacterium]
MHRQLLSIVVLVLLLIITFNESAFSQSNQKMSQRLQRALEVHSQQESIVAWVFFRDKGRNLNKKLDAAESSLSPHAYQRRLRSRGTGNLVDYHDLQVVADYIDQIASRVSGIRHKSRWLNAVSVEASGNILADIAHLPFVKKMDLVFRTTVPFPQEPIPISPSLQQQFDKRHTLDYGPSFTQNNQINVPS